jgi:hypothetical protein
MARSPILVLSTRRAGSTLLRLLLDTHPAICSPGELFLGRLCDSLYTAVEATQSSSRAEETIEARRRRCLAETRRIVDRLMDRYCALNGKERWCEKAGDIEFLAHVLSVFPDAKCIVLHRQCLDVVRSSIEMYGPSPQRQYMGTYHGRSDARLTAAWIDHWCVWTERLLAVEKECAGRAIRVRYEDLVRDPDAALRTILTFVGESWTPGLARRVFAMPHTLGHGDPKVILSHGVVSDRIGRGRVLDVSGVDESILHRMRRLLDALGYDRPRPVPARQDARWEVTSVAELFNLHFPRQLARYNQRLQSSDSVLGIRVTGSEPGMWRIHVDSSGAHINAGAGPAACTVVFDAGDLLNVVNRKLSVAEMRDRIRIDGDRESFDRPLGERLMWTLFGEDLRPRLSTAVAGAS